MKTRAKFEVALLSLIVSLLFAFPLWAQWGLTQRPVDTTSVGPGEGNIKIGPIKVHPFLGVTETYNDNIYKSWRGLKAESDTITSLSPGIRLLLPLQRHSLAFDYRADINLFSKFSETNYTTQQTGMAFNFDFPGGLTGTISDYYSDDRIPRKGKEVQGISGANDIFRDLPYTTNDFNTRVRYQFVDRWSVEGRYNNYDWAYKNSYDDAGSFKRNLYGGALFYRFTPKTDVLIDYSYSSVDYKSNSIMDNKNQTLQLGLSFDPKSRLFGDLRIGLTQKDYNNKLAGRNDSISTLSSQIDLGYILTDKDLLNLMVWRSILEDMETYQPYINTLVSLGFRHVFSWNEKLSLNARIGYWTRKFEGSNLDADGTRKIRDDKQWFGEIGFAYALQRWLTLRINYSYADNDSNFISYKYTENKIWFNVVAAF